jgi:hypothetical protein
LNVVSEAAFSFRRREMPSIDQKTARLKVAKQKVDEFVAAGGDIGSKSAVPVGLEFVYAFADLAEEFGHKILKPIEKPKK